MSIWKKLFGGSITQTPNIQTASAVMEEPIKQDSQSFETSIQDGRITITKYRGSGLTILIPSTIEGLPVTSIGHEAFSKCTNLIGVVVPDSVTSIGYLAFASCDNLESISLGNGVTSIGQAAFYHCIRLYSVTIPNSVTSIEAKAFWDCLRLTKVTIGKSVTTIGDGAFHCCLRLMGVYFEGDAPTLGEGVFQGDDNAVVLYLPSTKGWRSSFGGRPTAQWNQN